MLAQEETDGKPAFKVPSEAEIAQDKIKAATRLIFRLKDDASGSEVEFSKAGILATIFAEQKVTVEWTGKHVGMSIARIDDVEFDASTTVDAAEAFAAAKINSLKAAVASSSAGINFEFIEPDSIAYVDQTSAPNDDHKARIASIR